MTGFAVGDRVVLQAGEGRAGLVCTRGVDYDGGWAEFALARVDTRHHDRPGGDDALEQISSATGGRGLAVAFDFAGVPAVREQAALALGYSGRLVLVGLTDQPLRIADGVRFSFLKQQVRGHYGSDAGDVPTLVRLVSRGRLSLAKSVTATFPLSEAPAVVEKLRNHAAAVRFVPTP